MTVAVSNPCATTHTVPVDTGTIGLDALLSLVSLSEG